MKASVGLLLGVGAACVAYAFWKKNQAAQPSMPLSNPGNAQPAQPSQQYPWAPTNPARVDNQSQPWYNGSTAFQGGPVDYLNQTAGALKAGSSVVHSLSDIWGDFSNFFGGDSASDNLIASADDWDMWAGLDIDGMWDDSSGNYDVGYAENEVMWA